MYPAQADSGGSPAPPPLVLEGNTLKDRWPLHPRHTKSLTNGALDCSQGYTGQTVWLLALTQWKQLSCLQLLNQKGSLVT